MSRKLRALSILLLALLAFTAVQAFAADEYPDPRPISPIEVDPDGLEGYNAPSGDRTPAAAFEGNDWFLFLRALLGRLHFAGLI